MVVSHLSSFSFIDADEDVGTQFQGLSVEIGRASCRERV